MSSKSKNEDILLDVTLELLDSRKKMEKSTRCLGCGELFKIGTLLICSSCFDSEATEYFNLASSVDDEWEDLIHSIPED